MGHLATCKVCTLASEQVSGVTIMTIPSKPLKTKWGAHVCHETNSDLEYRLFGVMSLGDAVLGTFYCMPVGIPAYLGYNVSGLTIDLSVKIFYQIFFQFSKSRLIVLWYPI